MGLRAEAAHRAGPVRQNRLPAARALQQVSGRKEESRASSTTGRQEEHRGLPPGWDNAQASGDFGKSSLGQRESRKPEGKEWRREAEGREWREPMQIMLPEGLLFKNLFSKLLRLQEEKQLQ